MDIDEHTLNDSPLDGNSPPDQPDTRRVKTVAQERPMATPEVSQRTPDA